MRQLKMASAVTSIGCVWILASGVWAGDLPYVKPGLWSIQTVSGAKNQPLIQQVCIDAATRRKMLAMGESTSKEICPVYESQTNGNVTTTRSVCNLGGSKLSSNAKMTVSEESFHSESSGTFSPAFMGQTRSDTTQDGKWVGPCEPGMSPGDMFMVDHSGRRAKVNINQMGGGK